MLKLLGFQLPWETRNNFHLNREKNKLSNIQHMRLFETTTCAFITFWIFEGMVLVVLTP